MQKLTGKSIHWQSVINVFACVHDIFV